MTKVRQDSGFTIIEVVLFLAISGLMMAGLFVATNGAVSNQRYGDTVVSLQDFFQTQYDNVINVENDRPGTQSCSLSTNFTTTVNSVPGTTECNIIGRLISIDSSGKNITSQPVYTRVDVTDPSVQGAANDQAAITAMRLTVPVGVNSTQYSLGWQTKAVAPNSSPINFSMLIYRSPLSGNVNAIWSKTSALTGIQETDPLQICIDPAGLTTIPKMGVEIRNQNHGTSDAVSRIGGGTC